MCTPFKIKPQPPLDHKHCISRDFSHILQAPFWDSTAQYCKPVLHSTEWHCTIQFWTISNRAVENLRNWEARWAIELKLLSGSSRKPRNIGLYGGLWLHFERQLIELIQSQRSLRLSSSILHWRMVHSTCQTSDNSDSHDFLMQGLRYFSMSIKMCFGQSPPPTTL